MFNGFIFRACVLVLFFTFNFEQVNAKKNQQIKSISQIFDGIGQSNSDIFAFARSTMEEDSLYNQDSSYELRRKALLSLDLQFTALRSDSEDENVGHYLNTTLDEILRERITKDYITDFIIETKDQIAN